MRSSIIKNSYAQQWQNSNKNFPTSFVMVSRELKLPRKQISCSVPKDFFKRSEKRFKLSGSFQQMTGTWRSKINAHYIIQRNLIRHIHNNKYTIKKYIQIHNRECTEISPRDSCFAQWGSSDESRDHCAAKIQHINIPRQYESQLRQQSTRKQRMVNDVTPFLKYAIIENYKEFCQAQALWGRQSRRA